jgi:hypothetical protein
MQRSPVASAYAIALGLKVERTRRRCLPGSSSTAIEATTSASSPGEFGARRWSVRRTQARGGQRAAVRPRSLASNGTGWTWRATPPGSNQTKNLRRAQGPGGWKSWQMVDRYAKFATDKLLSAASRIERGRGRLGVTEAAR